MGGAENQVIALADRLASLGHAVLVISLTGEQLVRHTHPGVRVEPLRMARNAFSFMSAYHRARRLLLEFSPHVVHSHMVHANLFARLLRLATPMPMLVCTAHNTNEGGAARMWAYRLTDRLADLTTNVSEEAVQAFIRRKAVRPGRMVAMYNGIDCARFRFSPEDRVQLRQALGAAQETQVMLAVGRFTEQKDYSNMLRAFASVRAKRCDCVLWIVGTGEEQPRYENEAVSLGIGDSVHFLGLRRDVPALMSAADIFVLSSAWEGLPLVIGEAMACERIVVSTDAGGIREWMGNTGYVTPIRDSDALSRAMLAALDLSPEEKHARGMAARERVTRQFSLETIVARWLQVYQGRFMRPGASQHGEIGAFLEQRGHE
ncbi:glycosyltransferase [Herbaspirillum sp. HC18]|nr:glycosyltransferase [Herbaspirillum sp. HC18]